MIIEVRRETLEPCCAGRMYVDGEYFGFTLERPWLDNKPNVSAIPAGEYGVTVAHSNRFKRPMMRLLKVPGRAGILIHNANFAEQLRGCIAVARTRYNMEHIYGGLAPALKNRVESALSRGEAVKIRITNPSPTPTQKEQ